MTCFMCNGSGEYWYSAHGPQTTRCPVCFGTGVEHKLRDQRSLLDALDYQWLVDVTVYGDDFYMMADVDTWNAWMEVVFEVQC